MYASTFPLMGYNKKIAYGQRLWFILIREEPLTMLAYAQSCQRGGIGNNEVDTDDDEHSPRDAFNPDGL